MSKRRHIHAPAPRNTPGSTRTTSPDGAAAVASGAQDSIAADAARRWARRPLGVETVLLLDPDPIEASRLAQELLRFGVRLVPETEPFRAIARVAAGDVDLLIVNACLGADQLRTLVTVVRQEAEIPVVLAHGPDDYDSLAPAVLAGARPIISLPYEPSDVARALRSTLLNRPQARRIQMGELSITIDSYDVTYAGHGLDLSRLEYDLLLALARAGGRVVSRAMLTQALWPDSGNAEDLLGAAVSRIRRKLEPLGIAEAVHTVRGVGYRLDPDALTTSLPLGLTSS